MAHGIGLGAGTEQTARQQLQAFCCVPHSLRQKFGKSGQSFCTVNAALVESVGTEEMAST